MAINIEPFVIFADWHIALRRFPLGAVAVTPAKRSVLNRSFRLALIVLGGIAVKRSLPLLIAYPTQIIFLL